MNKEDLVSLITSYLEKNMQHSALHLNSVTVSDFLFESLYMLNLPAMNSRFDNCSYTIIDFTNSQLANSTFLNSTFDMCQFVDIILYKNSFLNCQFKKTNFIKADGIECLFENCKFVACDFKLTNFETCTFKNCQFIDCVNILETTLSKKNMIKQVAYSYQFFKKGEKYHLRVEVGGAAMYTIAFELNEEETKLYEKEGLDYIDKLVRHVQKNNKLYIDRNKKSSPN